MGFFASVGPLQVFVSSHVSVFSNPDPPTHPSTPSIMMNICIGTTDFRVC
jgi:hypothetical protein